MSAGTETRRHATLLPGTHAALEFERDGQGRLVGLRCAGRAYLATIDGRQVWDGGFALVEELPLGDRLLRRVHATGTRWDELYRWDEQRRPVHVDGVDVERDARGRVVACRDTLGGGATTWRYRYGDDGVGGIESPQGARAIAASLRGAPRAVSAPPAGWERDALGRLWLVRDAAGAIVHTYLWDGLRCLARVDGPPGAPLAALFSLDPSGTPVRVLTREGARRLPRDAFGEGLLAERGVPGLFGGAVHDGAVHYRSRALLPREGRFAQPDPLHGGEGDPRRRDGFSGPLWAETRGGPFAVCQHDPVSRADPLGEFSVPVLLSDLTWSLQNNILAIFGLDLTINFWLSLTVMPFAPLKTPGDKIENALDYFLYDGFFGTRQDTWAIRRGGLIAGNRVFTFQHLLFDAGHELPGDANQGVSLEQMSLTRAIDPQGEFRPRLYGSLLQASPDGAAPFLLVGDRLLGTALNLMSPAVAARGWASNSGQTVNALYQWTRAGGVGVPAFPGSRIPAFPEGGLHLDVLIGQLAPETACPVEELTPSGSVAVGTMSGRVRLSVPETGLGLAAGGLVLLTDAGGRAAMLPIDAVEEADGATSLWLDDDPGNIDRTGLRLRSLASPAASIEDLAAAGSELNLVGATVPAGAPGGTPDYTLDEALRFATPAAATTFLGAATVSGFVVRLQLDAAPPAGDALTVQRASVVGQHKARTTGAADTLKFDAADLPGSGDAIVVTSGALSLAVVLETVDPNDATVFTLDRPLAGFPTATANTELDWAALVPLGNDLAGNGSAAGDVLSYTPAVERAAPPVGEHVLLTNAGTGLSARRILAVQADALVTAAPLPAGSPLRVERFAYPAAGAVDVDDVSIVAAVNVVQTTQQDLAGPVLAVLQLGAPPLAAGGTELAQYVTAPAGAEVTLDLGAGAPPLVNALFPSSVVVLTDGTAVEPALVRRIRLRVTLDRVLEPIHGQNELEVVLLAAGGPGWDAAFVDAARIRVLPTIGGTAAQMPRFSAGDVVRVTGGAAVSGRVSEADGLLLTLEAREADLPLAGAAGTPVVTLQDYGFVTNTAGNVTRPADPGTGGTRSGRRGTGIDGGTGTPKPPSILEIDVWDPTVLGVGTRIGIIVPAHDDLPASTYAASVGAVNEVRLTFGATPGLSGTAATPVRVTPIAAVAGFVSRQWRQEGDDRVVVIPDVPAGITLAEQLVALIPFAAEDDAARTDGVTTSGTYKVPNEPAFESERRDALINHELQHTFQSAMWGPLLFCWFPLLAAQIPLELKGEVDVPKFSASVTAFVEKRGQDLFLKIADAQDIPFDRKDKVQITTSVDKPVVNTISKKRSSTEFEIIGHAVEPGVVQVWQGDNATLAVQGQVRRVDGVDVVTVPVPGGFTFEPGSKVSLEGVAYSDMHELGPKAKDGAFQIAGGHYVPEGTVRVRRAHPTGWVTAFEVLRGFSAGSISTSIIETTWGQLLRFIGKGLYGAGRAICGSDDRAPASVSQDRLSLEFVADLPKNLLGVDRVIVTQQDSMLTARVVPVPAAPAGGAPATPAPGAGPGAKLQLTSQLPWSGSVEVAPYSTTNPTSDFDWYDYFPASANIPQRPFAIRIEAVGGKSLELEPFHRVLLRAGKTELVAQVTAVDADGVVELSEQPPTLGPEAQLQVAKIDFEDPAAISAFNPRGMDWLRIVLDPWAQLDYRTQSKNEVARWFSRAARWAFGSHSWSLAIPGFYLLDNAFKQIGSNGHLSQMEQDASASSGDLYSPMSRLEPDEDEMFVGDLANFWYWPWGTGRDVSTIVRAGVNVPAVSPFPGGTNSSIGDAPGLQYANGSWPQLMPDVTAEVDTTTPVVVNMGATTPNGSGAKLPDALIEKPFVFPARDDPTANAPTGFNPGQQGFVPVGPKVERPIGCYVAFTQSGSHRVSVSDGITSSLNAREQHEGRPLFGASQPILFDVTVQDLTVRVAGQAAAEGATVNLVLTQRAGISVKAGDDDDDIVRDHVLALQAPAGGAVLRRDGDFGLEARGTVATEVFEIRRRYSGGSPELATNGLHLGGTLDVPVRRLTANVIDTLSVFAPLPDGLAFAGNPATNVVANLAVGATGFLLVPTRVRGELTLALVDGAAPGASAPVLAQSAPATVDPLLTAALGAEGGVLQFSFTTAAPLAASAALELRLPVGRDGNEAELRVTLTLDP